MLKGTNNITQCTEGILNTNAKAINKTFAKVSACFRDSEYILHEILHLRA